jgi:hypothetical protein
MHVLGFLLADNWARISYLPDRRRPTFRLPGRPTRLLVPLGLIPPRPLDILFSVPAPKHLLPLVTKRILTHSGVMCLPLN